VEGKQWVTPMDFSQLPKYIPEVSFASSIRAPKQPKDRLLVSPSVQTTAINHRPMQLYWHAACMTCSMAPSSKDVLDARPLFAFCSTEVH